LRFILESPLLLLVFAVLPGSFILGNIFHFKLPFRFSTNMLLTNSLCLLALLAIRLLWYLYGLRRGIRYGSGQRPSRGTEMPGRPAAQLREDLERSGYCFAADGGYGEKRDRGYLGTALVYGGLILLIGTGTWDNLRQFSGVVLHGMGVAASLDKVGTYVKPIMAGRMAVRPRLPKLEVKQIIFPNKEHTKGAAEIILLSKEGKQLASSTLIATQDPFRYNGYDIFLAKLLVEAHLIITEKGSPDRIIFTDTVKLSPLWKKEGDYGFYGVFTDRAALDGELFYNADKNLFRVVMTREGKKLLDTEYPFQVIRQKQEGNYLLTFGAMGRWTELHVVRSRGMALLWIGGIIAVLGLLLRIAFRPQRIWLEETPEGCRVWTVGKNPLRDES